MKHIKIEKNGIKLAGNLHLPSNFNEDNKYKAIVVTHPGGGVKEQVADAYAIQLCKTGYVVVTFDASHQGASEGLPRYIENPEARVTDISAVVDYLTTQKFISEIGALGICAGGGYTLTAIQVDKRIKTAATISAVDIGLLFRGEDPEVMNQTLDLASSELTNLAMSNEPNYLYYTPMTQQEADASDSVLYKQAYEYYRTEWGMHVNAPGKFLLASLNGIYRFNSTPLMSELTTIPTLLVAGSAAETLSYTKLAADKITNSKVVEIEGASHIDLYDKKVAEVSTHLIDFYNETL